jgi:hypothetical protein
MNRIKKIILDWYHGWSEPKPWERDALHLMEVLAHDGRRKTRNHEFDEDCWCAVCSCDKATKWINDYWARRLKRSSTEAKMIDGTLEVTLKRP